MLDLAQAEARALIAGEIIVAFADRGTVTEGDEVSIAVTGELADESVKPAYRRWSREPLPDGPWSGVVESVDPATILDPQAGLSRHLRTSARPGDVVVIRIYGPDGPVLTDAAYEARRKSVEGALRT